MQSQHAYDQIEAVPREGQELLISHELNGSRAPVRSTADPSVCVATEQFETLAAAAQIEGTAETPLHRADALGKIFSGVPDKKAVDVQPFCAQPPCGVHFAIEDDRRAHRVKLVCLC